MAVSLARQTIFALVDAVERDLGALILKSSLDTLPLVDCLGADLHARCHARYTKDGGVGQLTLDNAVYYLDLGDKIPVLNRNARLVSPVTLQHLKTEHAALTALVAPRNRVFHGRPLKASDLATVDDLCTRLERGAPDIWCELARSLSEIRERPDSVLGIEIPVQADVDEPMNNLPATDFDETGFIGRKQELDAVTKALLGPFPVVSLLAEGGYGKSAVALQVAYDLLESDERPFEAIIWVTAKTSTLTGTELRRVENAITTTLGLFTKLAEELGAPAGSDPLADILDYLKHFRILLILDNLETVLDSRVTEFLSRLSGESKILITSRIGVGAPEFPIRLAPMTEVDAVSLLRATAVSRSVKDLVSVPNDRLKGYCNRLTNNPAWIKWFVSGVQSGRSPEQLLGQPEEFLAFCLSNVYEHLDLQTREFLSLLQFEKLPVGAPEAAHILQRSPDALHTAAAVALRSNMAVHVSQSVGRSYFTGYELSELARKYLQRHHPVPAEVHTLFVERKKKMRSESEQILNAARLRPYDEMTVRARDSRDTVVAKMLRDALRALPRQDYAQALRLSQEAIALAPDNAECYRVAASVHARLGNHSAALEFFGIAVETEPTLSTAHYFFGRFLTDALGDIEAGLSHLERALHLDPQSHEVRIALARALMYRADHERAIDLIRAAVSAGLGTSHLARIAYTTLIDCHSRIAEAAVDSRDLEKALAALEEARRVFDATANSLRDGVMRAKLIKAVLTAARLRELVAASGVGAEWDRRASEILTWYKSEAADPAATRSPQYDTFVKGERLEATIERIARARGYSFLTTHDHRVIFAHKSEYPSVGCWNDAFIGQRFSFTVEVQDDKPRGVRLIELPLDRTMVAPGIRLGGTARGRVISYSEDSGIGFVELAGGEQLFFHRTDSIPEDGSRRATVGDEVSFRVGVSVRDPRPKATEIQLVYSG